MKKITHLVRTFMMHLAGFIDYWTRGFIRPAHITALSLAGHIPVAWALIVNRPVLAAGLLAFFGIMDALDGAMARVQGRVSKSGMYFDAVSDRVKEVIVYSALAILVYRHIDPTIVWQVVTLCGTSLLVSYVKAKGEMAVGDSKKDTQKLNRLFGGGIASYEMRVVAIIIALVFGIIPYVLPIMIALTLLTAALRFLVVAKLLYEQDEAKLEKKKSKQK